MGGHSLALRLLGDVADGGPLLADDGSDVLRGHQQPQGDVGVRRLVEHPRARGARARPPPGPVSTPAVFGPSLASISLRVLVGDVGDAQGVVLKLVSIQLLDGSEGRQQEVSIVLTN